MMLYRAGAMMMLTTLAVCGHAAVFYVAPDGNDSWSGTLPEANLESTDGPFATLQGARDATRELRQGPEALEGAVQVILRGGVYRITETLELTQEDSGAAEAPVVWRSAPGEEVRLVGGARLTGFAPVTAPAVLERLRPEARQHVQQADLRTLGVEDLGTPTPAAGSRAELVFNTEYMPLARYPDAGEWLTISRTPEGTEEERREHPHGGTHYGRFAYDSERPEGWADTEEVWVHGYWVHDWRDQYHRVQKLDTENREVWPEPPYHGYGYRPGQRFYFLNVLEELDSPGEWYIDRASGILYFWPPEPIEEAEVVFPELRAPMFRLTDTQHVWIMGMTFEAGRGRAVEINGGTHNEIAGCTVRNFGSNVAVSISGTHNGVRSSDLYQLAGTAIALSGGDRATLTPGHNYVLNCHIHDVAQTFRTYHGAVSTQGVGHRIAHCYIHDMPHLAISYGGNDHLIEYCDFTRIATETGDVGVTYTAMDWTYMGHEFRYNYFHNIHGPGRLGCRVIYPDLPCGGIHLHGNVFHDVEICFYTNSGRAMVIENNIFLGANWAIGFGVWRQEEKFLPGGSWRMVERLEEAKYDQPPYITRYPALQRLAEDFALGDEHWIERSKPRDNLVRRNISATDLFLRLDPLATLGDVRTEDNLIADEIAFTGSFTGDGNRGTYRAGDPELEAEFGKRGNVLSPGDPHLGDLETQDFRPVPDSPAWDLGFEPIPFGRIGMYVDEWRTSLPVRVSKPVITPAGRVFTTELEVRLIPTPQAGGPKAVIRYTLDGTEPTEDSAVYSGRISITADTTLQAAAFAERDGVRVRSETVSESYRLAEVAEGAVFLSDLEGEDVFAYPGCWRRDENYQGRPLSIGGWEFPKGLLLHPDEKPDGTGIAHVTYTLDGGLAEAQWFRALIGIDDAMHVHGLGSATFIVEVYRDGEWERVFESGVRKLGDEPREVEVEIAGAEKLRLVTTDAGDGIACDHAVWAQARVE